MELFVKTSPFQAAHFRSRFLECRINPVYDCIKISLDFVNVRIVTMHAHILFDALRITGSNPFQSSMQIILTICAPRNIIGPNVDFRTVRIRKLFLRLGHKGTRINGIQEFLLIQWNARDVDGLEPLLDFSLFALANIDKQFRIVDFLLNFVVKPSKILFHSISIFYSKLTCNKTTDRSNSLLTVENFKFTVLAAIEINET